jgi:hypothetical protein
MLLEERTIVTPVANLFGPQLILFVLAGDGPDEPCDHPPSAANAGEADIIAPQTIRAAAPQLAFFIFSALSLQIGLFS